MKILNMFPNQSKKNTHSALPHPPSPIARSNFWVRAPHSGILKTFKTLGSKVKKGEVMGIIVNPIGEEEYKVNARISGMIIGQTNLPLVHEGAALFNIGAFKHVHIPEAEVEDQPPEEPIGHIPPWI